MNGTPRSRREGSRSWFACCALPAANCLLPVEPQPEPGSASVCLSLNPLLKFPSVVWACQLRNPVRSTTLPTLRPCPVHPDRSLSTAHRPTRKRYRTHSLLYLPAGFFADSGGYKSQHLLYLRYQSFVNMLRSWRDSLQYSRHRASHRVGKGPSHLQA